MNILTALIKISKKKKSDNIAYFIVSKKQDSLSYLNIGDVVYIEEEQDLFIVIEHDNKKVLIGLE